MSHINLPAGSPPGIRGLLNFRPETAGPLNQLADILLHQPPPASACSDGTKPLSPGERELIAVYVSSLNNCHFCQSSHGAVAAAHFCSNGSNSSSESEQLVLDVRSGDPDSSTAISPKLKALMAVAAQVVKGGKEVTADAVGRAWAEGATDLDIHDTVLIAAAFCMYNRYVDGLATWAPQDSSAYRDSGRYLATHGYKFVASGQQATKPETNGEAARNS